MSVVNVNEIKSVDWSMKIGFYGQVTEALDDIEQCILTIMKTRKGSVPLDPEFGCDVWRYIDQPINMVIPDIVRETYSSLTLYEPRIDVVSVKTEVLSESSIKVLIEWKLKDSEITKITEVIYERQ